MNRSRPALHKALLAEVPAESRLLLGVSGGVDSMVLLHGVMALRAELRLTVEVAHIDHGLRPESSEDGAFVAAAARLHDLPFHIVRADPPTGGVNIEAWGRKTRYDFFKTIRLERSLDWSLTAHTADDVAETLLMRLVSNKELRTIHRRDNGAALLRPLLGVTRDEVVRYAREFGVVWREDGTNLDRTFLRNRVRHEVLPVLRRFDERIVDILCARAEALATDDSYLEGEALRLLQTVTFGWGERGWIQGVREVLQGASPAIRWRIGERIAFSKLGFRIGRFHAVRVVEFLLGNGAILELPGKTSFIRRDGGLVVVESGSRDA